MHDDRLTGLDVQRIVDALQGGQAGGCDGAGLRQVEQGWRVRRAPRREGHVLGVEPALRVGEAVGIGAIADL